MGAALQRNLQNMRRGGGSAPPVHEHRIFIKCHSEERSDVGIRIPLTAAYHAEGVRIATPVCAPVRNDRFFAGAVRAGRWGRRPLRVHYGKYGAEVLRIATSLRSSQ